MKKIEIYTSIAGGKDSPRDDILCFSGNPKFNLAVMQAKAPKVLSHLYIFSEYSIWVDGNIKLLIPPEDLIDKWLEDKYEMAVWKHPGRNCIYEEAVVCQRIYPQITEDLDKQTRYYLAQGYPAYNGLYEMGVIVRKHTDTVKALNESWWAEICRWSFRDQISFPYVLNKFPHLKLNIIEGNVRRHKYFEYELHKK